MNENKNVNRRVSLYSSNIGNWVILGKKNVRDFVHFGEERRKISVAGYIFDGAI